MKKKKKTSSLKKFFILHFCQRNLLQKPWTKILLLVNVGSLEKRSNHAAKILSTKTEKSKGLCTWKWGTPGAYRRASKSVEGFLLFQSDNGAHDLKR